MVLSNYFQQALGCMRVNSAANVAFHEEVPLTKPVQWFSAVNRVGTPTLFLQLKGGPSGPVGSCSGFSNLEVATAFGTLMLASFSTNRGCFQVGGWTLNNDLCISVSCCWSDGFWWHSRRRQLLDILVNPCLFSCWVRRSAESTQTLWSYRQAMISFA